MMRAEHAPYPIRGGEILKRLSVGLHPRLGKYMARAEHASSRVAEAALTANGRTA